MKSIIENLEDMTASEFNAAFEPAYAAQSSKAFSRDDIRAIVEAKQANRQLHLAAQRILSELASSDNMTRIAALQSLVTR